MTSRSDRQRELERDRRYQYRARAGQPIPEVQDRDWASKAACKSLPLSMFFPSAKGKAPKDPWAEPRKVCDRCPVRDDCLADALRDESVRGAHGMRGGLTPSERRLGEGARRFAGRGVDEELPGRANCGEACRCA